MLALIALIIINYYSANYFFRIDLTEDKRYTLDDQTIYFLKKLDDVISIDVYLDGDDFPADLRKLQNGLKEKLVEFKAYGGRNIQYRFIDPNEDKEMAADFTKQIENEGVLPSNIVLIKKNKSEIRQIWPGLILRQAELSDS